MVFFLGSCLGVLLSSHCVLPLARGLNAAWDPVLSHFLSFHNNLSGIQACLMSQQDFMAEQCAATDLKPLYLDVETPSFYTWTSALGFAKGKEGLKPQFVQGVLMDLSVLWS